jgi:hypothetical protein
MLTWFNNLFLILMDNPVLTANGCGRKETQEEKEKALSASGRRDPVA